MDTTNTSSHISTFIQNLPKAEIHIHLEGSIQPKTVLALARRHNKLDKLPASNLAGIQQWFTFSSFSNFIKAYVVIQDLICSSEDFALIAYQCGADMAAQNIRYREATITPYTHTNWQNKGLTINDILDGLEAGRQKAKAEFGVEMRWVFDIPRNLSFINENKQNSEYNRYPAERTLEFALAGQNKGVVGFGLGGNEIAAPPEPFAHAFAEAKKAGLLSVPHAGETQGPASVWGAINNLQADRIGHGVRSIEDPNLLALLKERQIPLEINPTSNICLHVYRRLAEHPFPHLDRMGLLVTVNSDDPPFFNTNLCQEYQVLVDEFGYTEDDLVRIARNAFVVCGAESEVKEKLLKEFDAWVNSKTSC